MGNIIKMYNVVDCSVNGTKSKTVVVIPGVGWFVHDVIFFNTY